MSKGKRLEDFLIASSASAFTKVVHVLATWPKTNGRIPVLCWTRRPPPKFKLSD